MSDDTRIDDLVEKLVRAHETRKPIPRPSKSGHELTLEEAFEVQEAVSDRLSEGSSKRIVGYKAGLSTPPFVGRILPDGVVLDGGAIAFTEMIAPLIECEIGFVIGETLSGDDLTVTDVLRATDFVVPTFEIVDKRFETDEPPTANELVADNGAFARMVVGGCPIGVGDIDLRRVGVELRENGRLVAAGRSNRSSAHPAHAVISVATQLHRVGKGFHPGDIVLTGSCIEPYEASPDTVITTTLQGIGSVEVAFAG